MRIYVEMLLNFKSNKSPEVGAKYNASTQIGRRRYLMEES